MLMSMSMGMRVGVWLGVRKGGMMIKVAIFRHSHAKIMQVNDMSCQYLFPVIYIHGNPV